MSAYFNYGNDSGTNVLVARPGAVLRRRRRLGEPDVRILRGDAQGRRVLRSRRRVRLASGNRRATRSTARRSGTFQRQTSKLAAVGVAGFVDRYQGPTMGQAQSDNSLLLDVLTKSALDFQVFTGSNYWRFGDILTPISQNGGFQFTYDSGLQTNNPGNFPIPRHVVDADDDHVQHRAATARDASTRGFARRRSASATAARSRLALDDTAQWLPPRYQSNIQWFESLSYAYQIGRNSSFAVGLRQVIGYPPIPNGGGDCVGTRARMSRSPTTCDFARASSISRTAIPTRSRRCRRRSSRSSSTPARRRGPKGRT